MHPISCRYSLVMIGLVIVMALVFFSGCSHSPSSSRTQNIIMTPLPVMIEEFKTIPTMSPRISLVICPFTNSNHEITVDALQFYFPTVFKASWTPTRIYNAPFDSYVYLSANRWGLFSPRKQFPQEMAVSFANSFGSKNYVTATIDKQETKYHITLSIFRENSTTHQETMIIPENEAPLIPGKLALAILESMVPDKINNMIKQYVQRPAAGTPETLHKTGLEILGYFAAGDEFNNANIKQMIDADNNLDWAIPIYINMVSGRNIEKAVNLADSFAIQKSDNPRYQILYAAMLYNNGKYKEAIDAISGIIAADPDNSKARIILAQSVEELNKSIEADPYYQALIKLEPDSAWTNYYVGAHKIELAWQHRGSGWAYTVDREGWRNFDRELNAAYKYLHRSTELDPYQEEAYAKLITVGMGLSLNKGEVREYFKRAQAIDPNVTEPYDRYQTFLMPKWGGSIEELRELWTDTGSMKLQNPYIYLFPVDGHLELARYYARGKDGKLDMKEYSRYFQDEQVWDDVHQAYEKFFTYGINNPNCHAWYGYIAEHCGKYDIAFDQFELTNFKFQDDHLVSYQNILHAYGYAAYKTGHYDRALEVAQMGLKTNHCPECNENFQKLINLVQKEK
ncbi:MAG: tetratricopeptide repeat protein [bacterium]